MKRLSGSNSAPIVAQGFAEAHPELGSVGRAELATVFDLGRKHMMWAQAAPVHNRKDLVSEWGQLLRFWVGMNYWGTLFKPSRHVIRCGCRRLPAREGHGSRSRL